MGSGFRTFAASEVLTSSNVQNYLMDQAVTVHGSTAILGTAIPSPEAGMVAYVDSGDSSEGLYTFTGSAWRKGPGWNAPWGYVGNGILGSVSAYTSGTAWAAAFTISLSSLVANRRYLLQAFMSLEPGNTGQIEVEVGSGIGSGTLGRGFYYANGVSWVTSIAVAGMFNTTAGSMTRYVSMRKSSGVGGVRALVGSTYQVIDLGPSGAPA
jgi:hypothetical protein